MEYLHKHSDSKFPSYRRRVPQDLMARLAGSQIGITLPAVGEDRAIEKPVKFGTVVKFSLESQNPATVKVRRHVVTALLESYFESLRNEPIDLTHKQLMGLKGEVYERYTTIFSDNPGDINNWATIKGICRAVLEGRMASPSQLSFDIDFTDEVRVAGEFFGYDLTAGINSSSTSEDNYRAMELRYGLLANWVLTKHGLNINIRNRVLLLEVVHDAVTKACQRLKLNASGDYSPDVNALTFPRFEPLRTRCTILTLFDKWKEADKSISSIKTARTACSSLNTFVAGADISDLTDLQIRQWRTSLMQTGRLSIDTINTSYMSMIKAILNWSVEQGNIEKNVASEVRGMTVKRRENRQPYTDEEIGRLIEIARACNNDSVYWLIMLQVSTGARVGEICQLWKSSIVDVDGVTVINIAPAPDGGRLKNATSERQVPVSQYLQQNGFSDWLKSRLNGPLFYRLNPKRKGKEHPSSVVGDYLAKWIRQQGFTSSTKSPNHAFRHWWKSAASRHGIQDTVADAIQGHRTPGAATRYRHFDLRTLERAVNSIWIPVKST